jgi:outer membrane protein W
MGLNGTTLMEDDLAMGGVSKVSAGASVGVVGVVGKDLPLKTSAMELSAVDPGLSCARSGKRS